LVIQEADICSSWSSLYAQPSKLRDLRSITRKDINQSVSLGELGVHAIYSSSMQHEMLLLLAGHEEEPLRDGWWWIKYARSKCLDMIAQAGCTMDKSEKTWLMFMTSFPLALPHWGFKSGWTKSSLVKNHILLNATDPVGTAFGWLPAAWRNTTSITFDTTCITHRNQGL